MNGQKWDSAARTRLCWALLAAAAASCLFALLLYRGEIGRGGYINAWSVVAGLGFVCAAGFLLQQRWARWLGLSVIAASMLALAATMLVSGFAWWPLIPLGILAVLGWRLRIARLSGDTADHLPLISLVLLFRHPVYLEPATLAALASRAWATRVDVATEEDGDERVAAEDARSLLIGESPHFLCSHWPALFAIHNIAHPYFIDVARAVEAAREMRVRQAIEAHGAWVSVDVVHWFGSAASPGRTLAYRLIARLLAELADENCLAVVEPAEGRVFVYDPETEAKLRSEDPLEALRDWYYPPVLAVEADDPEMQAAVEEARQHWPDFLAAFELRHEAPSADEPPFMVKAPFSDGQHVEYMWVRVTGVENDVIYGVLENTPAEVTSVKEGSRVRVRRDNLNDWVCVIDGKPAGAFTLKVLAQRSAKRTA